MARGTQAEVSDYEKQRLANIAERDAMMKKLSLEAASVGLAPKASKASKSSAAPKTHKKRDPVKKIKEEVQPRRTSSRLAGLTADSEVAKRKAEDDYEAQRQAERVKRQRVSDDLDLKDILVNGKKWDSSIVDVVSRGGKPYERTFGEADIKETTDKELRDLRERMSNLELYDGFEPTRSLPSEAT